MSWKERLAELTTTERAILDEEIINESFKAAHAIAESIQCSGRTLFTQLDRIELRAEIVEALRERLK